jgi:hypothetical protein
MSRRKIKKLVSKHPPEANAIAAVFSKTGAMMVKQSAILQNVITTLENNWSGRSKELFLGILRTEKTNLDPVVPLLTELTYKYYRYQVEVEEEIEVDV